DLTAWETWHPELQERTQVCEIVETATTDPVVLEGLMYRLIVRFHRFSLGRHDYRASIHWQNGIVLDDGYNGRALVTVDRNRVSVRVRAAYPQNLLFWLTREIREYVQSFWKGLDVRVMVPCGATCGRGRPGSGLFNVEALTTSREQQRPEFPCLECGSWQDIDELLMGIGRQELDDQNGLVHAVRAVVEPGFTRILDTITSHVVGAIDQLGTDTQAAVSQAEQRFRDLILALDGITPKLTHG